MANHAIFVDQEQSTQGNATGKENVVVPSDILVQIGDKRIVDLANSTLSTRRVPPCKVTEVTVDGDAQELNTQSFEFFDPIRKGNDLGRANKCEIQRVEKKHRVLATIIAQRDFFERTIRHDSLSFEFWCFLRD